MRILSLIIFLMFFAFIAKAGELSSNFDTLDSLVGEVAEEIGERVASSGVTAANLKFNAHQGLWLLKSAVINSCEKRDVKLFEKGKSEDAPELFIAVKNLGVNYKNADNSDTLRRLIQTDVSAYLRLPEGEISASWEISREYSDLISRKDVTLVECSGHTIASAPVPMGKRSLFEELAEPIIIVSSAIIVVVLLFSIRSG